MNPVSLYITTSRLVFQNGGGGVDSGGGTGGGGCVPGSSAFADLNRLLPYLRKSLSCAVCCRLLIEPHTPAELNCQHHVCRGCVGERKKLKPSCAACKDYNRYAENTQLRMLLQCYKSICEYIKTKPFFAEIRKQAAGNGGGGGTAMNGMSVGGMEQQQQQQQPAVPSNLWELIEEGARFQDNYRCSSGLTRSAYSILPCIYPVPPVTVSSPSPQPLSSSTSGMQQSNQQVIITSNAGGTIQLQAKVHPGATSDKIPSTYTVTGGSSLLQDKNSQQHHLPQQVLVHGRQTTQQQLQQQQQQQPVQKEIRFRSAPIKTVSNGSTMYSVLYAGNGNKITIKRKTDPPHIQRRATVHTLDKDGQIKLAKTLAENNSASSSPSTVVGFKVPSAAQTTAAAATSGTSVTAAGSGFVGQSASGVSAANNSKQSAKQLLKRRGCRCGNATATPGKLTCCGQRCPCYVDSKSCIDCKCRGCRNPHRADGMKVRPHIPELQNLEINLHNANAVESAATTTTSSGSSGGSIVSGMQQPTTMTTQVMAAGTAGLGGGKGHLTLGGPGTGVGGSTLKITPTSLANVLSGGSNQLIGGSHDGLTLAPSGGLLDANGFSYLTPASLEATPATVGAMGGVTAATVGGVGTTTQYTVPGSSLANGTIHVVNVYTTHLGDVSCSPTLSNMIRTDSGLNSLLTHKPPEALLTTPSQTLSSLGLGSPLIGHHHHSLFNPGVGAHAITTTAAINTPGGSALVHGQGVTASSAADLELDMSGTIDISDQLDLAGANLITIDGTALDDRLHHGEDV